MTPRATSYKPMKPIYIINIKWSTDILWFSSLFDPQAQFSSEELKPCSPVHQFGPGLRKHVDYQVLRGTELKSGA